MESTSSKN
jgi:hypothetical protein